MVVVFILIALVAAFILAMGFGVITSGADDAVASMGNYTANTSAWSGFTNTVNSYPLLIWIVFGGMVAFGVWQYLRRWKANRGDA